MLPKTKILIVDDDRVVADTLAIILNQSGFEATVAYSANMIADIVNALQPDILITDVVMAGMNGIEAAILVREMLPECKIFLLSGQAIAADLLDQAQAQGHKFEIIAKPVHPNQLIAYLRGDIALKDSA